MTVLDSSACISLVKRFSQLRPALQQQGGARYDPEVKYGLWVQRNRRG